MISIPLLFHMSWNSPSHITLTPPIKLIKYSVLCPAGRPGFLSTDLDVTYLLVVLAEYK